MKTKFIIVLLITVIVVGLCNFACAEENNAFNKLGRGLINTATGWLEIPKKIYNISKNDNLFLGITIGTFKGLGWGISRTAVGIYEIITFPFPIPEGYKPIIDPEFVFCAE